jgi:hypothetical protein
MWIRFGEQPFVNAIPEPPVGALLYLAYRFPTGQTEVFGSYDPILGTWTVTNTTHITMTPDGTATVFSIHGVEVLRVDGGSVQANAFSTEGPDVGEGMVFCSLPDSKPEPDTLGFVSVSGELCVPRIQNGVPEPLNAFSFRDANGTIVASLSPGGLIALNIENTVPIAVTETGDSITFGDENWEFA